MLVRVKKEEANLLRDVEVQTYQETFGPFFGEEGLAHYFDNELSLATIEKELANPESETYFVVKDGEIAGFLKFNWGHAQTEHELPQAFEVQRIYVLKAYHPYPDRAQQKAHAPHGRHRWPDPEHGDDRQLRPQPH